ncbi:MAG TPA: Ig-like domain-containing protein, partial [Gemmatimonadales bacterium]|nr:Ig-like domain-containing protein [Gemmatimonadales bacterium]
DKTGTGYTLTAAASGLTGTTSTTFNVTAGSASSVVKISGDNQTGAGGAALAQPLIVEVRDALANPVPGVTVNWATPSGGSLAPPSGPTGTNGRAQATWTLGGSLTSQTATATVNTVTPASFSATASIGTPAISLSFAGIPGVGIGLSSRVYVDINQAAPAGGTPITLVSGDATVFTVAPTSLTIPQGKTRDSVNVTCVNPGTTNLTATSSGFTDGVLSVNVQSRAIALPSSINVPYGQTAQIPVQIASPAPAGGVDIDVTSDTPANVAVQTSPLHINAGGLTVNATLIGVKPGSAVITASNPAYNFATSTATTSASLNIVQASATLNASFGTSITINFESNGQPTAAPAPGIAVTLAPVDGTCLAATTPVTIATGFVSTTATLSYGGSATLPCTTKLLAQATNLQPDSINVTVNPIPVINMFTPAQGTGRLGIGLQDQGNGSLQVANPGPGSLTVHLVSSDQTVLLLAPDASTAGTPTLDVQVPLNQSSISYFIQGVGTGTATISASAPLYANGTSPVVTVVTPGFDILGVPTSTTSLSSNTAFFVRLGAPNAGNTGLAVEQSVRAQAPTLTATIKNRNSGAAQLVTTALTAQQVTVSISAGQSRSPSTKAAGGVEYDPLGAGPDTVTATIPGFGIFPGTQDSVPVTVSAPLINMFTPAQGTGRLGVGLQDQGSGSLQVANPGPGSLTVHLVSSDPAVLLLAPDAATAGTPTLDVQVPILQSGFSYFIQGVGTGTATITASAPAYSNGTSPNVNVVTPGFDVLGVPSSTTSLAANTAFFVRLGAPNAANTALAVEQTVRAGGTTLVATIQNRSPAAAQLVTTSVTGPSVNVSINAGQSRSPSTKAAGGVEYDPLGAGPDTVTATIPGFVIFPGTADSVPITITAPVINMFTPAQGTGRLGVGLQDQGSGSLQTANPGPGALTVHLVSSDPTAMLLAPDATTPGTQTLDVSVPVNQSGFSYFIQGVATGTATVTASAPAYTNGTSPTVNVVTPGFDILGLPGSTTSL